jgi:hypothetical protein
MTVAVKFYQILVSTRERGFAREKVVDAGIRRHDGG